MSDRTHADETEAQTDDDQQPFHGVPDVETAKELGVVVELGEGEVESIVAAATDMKTARISSR